MCYFCAWSELSERCLEIDQRSTVERFAHLPADEKPTVCHAI
jgi:hypothetical protein